MSSRIEYGPNNALEVNSADYTSVDAMIFDSRAQTTLGYGDSISVATRSGVSVDMASAPRDGETYVVQSRSGTKGC